MTAVLEVWSLCITWEPLETHILWPTADLMNRGLRGGARPSELSGPALSSLGSSALQEYTAAPGEALRDAGRFLMPPRDV